MAAITVTNPLGQVFVMQSSGGRPPTIAFADLDSLETIAQKNSTNVWPDHVKTMERVLTWSMATVAPVLRDTKVGFYKY